jgi:hypothetical protein
MPGGGIARESSFNLATNIHTMTQSELHAARQIVRHLRALTDVQDQSCCVPAEAKEAVRLYVQSWILPQAEALAEVSTELSIWERAQRQWILDLD